MPLLCLVIRPLCLELMCCRREPCHSPSYLKHTVSAS